MKNKNTISHLLFGGGDPGKKTTNILNRLSSVECKNNLLGFSVFLSHVEKW